MKYFFVLLIFAIMFSPVVLGVYLNEELADNSDAVEYANRVNCGIVAGPDCNIAVVEE